MLLENIAHEHFVTSLQVHHPPITFSWTQPVQFMMSLNKRIIIILIVTEGEEKNQQSDWQLITHV
jgi:hypothetical protein